MYSFYELVFPQTTVKIVPGPGTYVNKEAIEHNPLGRYHLSNHRNSKAKVFNPPRSRRFIKSGKSQLKQLMMYQATSTIPKIIYLEKESMFFQKMYQLVRELSWMVEDCPSQTYLLEDRSVFGL